MAPAQRYSYLDGYLDGRTLGVSALAARLGPPADAQAKALLQRLPGLVDRRALERQIDRLYREPLNVYLSLDEAAFIAGEQIKGRPVEAELQRLRPDAYERYRILRQLDKH
ncbi:hypothetical protein [Cupriavidus sp. TMH.W2]|uniref:hypothetical protein n=1 Tax=Cupriavidus sp. TMH.W2 TaxID=3434465 RepID=UPI003D7745B7